MAQTNLFVGVNEPADPSNLTGLEKKHMPVIEAPAKVKKGQCFEISVEVGKLQAHPNEPAHFIEFIDVYADETFLARVDLTAALSCPKVTLCFSLPFAAKELRAYERCNIHGVWLGTKPIKVVE